MTGKPRMDERAESVATTAGQQGTVPENGDRVAHAAGGRGRPALQTEPSAA